MSDKKKAFEMYKAGFNCGQIVATYCSEACGNDEKTARAAIGGFGGGMHCGETCSAVIGAVYSLGVYCNHCEYGDMDANNKIVEMTKELTTRFKDEFGSLRCCDLLDEKDLGRCGNYLMKSTELVKELIERDKQNGNL